MFNFFTCIIAANKHNILICGNDIADNDTVKKIKRPHPLFRVLALLANFDIPCRWQIPLTTQKYPGSTHSVHVLKHQWSRSTVFYSYLIRHHLPITSNTINVHHLILLCVFCEQHQSVQVCKQPQMLFSFSPGASSNVHVHRVHECMYLLFCCWYSS